MPKTFSERLIFMLNQRDMSISKLSRKLSFSRQTIYHWLDNDLVSKKGLAELANVFGVCEQWLLYGDASVISKKQSTPRKHPFYFVAQNSEFDLTKRHLKQLDILVGSYEFIEGKVNYYNMEELPDHLLHNLPKTTDELYRFLPTKQVKRVVAHFVKLLRFKQGQIFTFMPFLNDVLYSCMMIPTQDKKGIINGLSFSVQPMQSNEEELCRYLQSKCRSCRNKKVIPRY